MTITKEHSTKFGTVVISLLKSYAPALLNSDDLGNPKTAYFGGTLRGRISSQAIKRAMRTDEAFTELFGEKAVRTRALPEIVIETLANEGYDEEFLKLLGNVLDTIFKGGDKDKKRKIEFYSPAEIDAFIDMIKAAWDASEHDLAVFEDTYMPKKAAKNKKGESEEEEPSAKKPLIKAPDTAMTIDQAFWGRMSTNPKLLESIDGAVSVAHALSTNANNNSGSSDFDYFVAVDDYDNSGAGHIGEKNFTSNCYYECMCVDLDQLYENLAGHDDRDEIMQEAIARLTYLVMTVDPKASQHTYFTATLPEAVYVYHVTHKNQAVSLINAFANAVQKGRDINKESVKLLAKYIDEKNRRFFQPDHQVWLVTNSRYADCKPEDENIEIVENVEQLGSTLTGWFDFKA